MAILELATVGFLHAHGTISEEEVIAATNAYLADRTAAPFKFKSGHVLNVTAAAEATAALRAVLADPSVKEEFRRIIVRTTVILATPEVG